MSLRKVIAAPVIALILLLTAPWGAQAQNPIDRKVDSLFMIASSGSVKYKDMVQPAIDSAAALGPQAVPRLLGWLDTKSPRERVTLAQILKKIGSPAVPALVEASKTDNGLAVERATYSLGEIGDSSAVPGLLAVANHPRWQVREQVIGSLGKLKSHRADSVIMSALGDSIGLVRKSAAVSCGQMKIESSIRSLVHLLGDAFYGARMPASLALLNLDTNLVAQAIGDSLASENHLLGNLGCWVLGKLKSDSSIKLLLGQLSAPDPDRRAHAACALVEADPQGKCLYRDFYPLNETDRLARLKFESAVAAAANVQPASR